MNPLNVFQLIASAIDIFAETTPARLRRKSVWHKLRAEYWIRQGDEALQRHKSAKTKRRLDKAKRRIKKSEDKLAHHMNLAELYSREATEMEEREDD